MSKFTKVQLCEQSGAPVTVKSTGVPTTFTDSHHIDSFGRLRVSTPTGIFDSQFTYDLQPLLFEQIVVGTGAAIAHSAVNRNAVMTFTGTPTGGSAIMQSFQCFRYQPGKSQFVSISFDFDSATANCLKFVGYSDGVNGVEFQNNGINNQFVIYSGTSNGNQTVIQSSWNIDKLDGTGPSGIVFNITATQIFVVDLQSLYSGRVRVGFDIGGVIVYCHEFAHANSAQSPYIQSANLPVRCGMTCTGTVTSTMQMTCCTVVSEGGTDKTIGYEFAKDFLVTAANGAATHALSIRPKQLFNGITNRATVYFIEIDLLVTGNSPVEWQLVLGQAISGTTTYTDVNTIYSSVEYNTVGAVSGLPAIVMDESYVPASNQSKGQGQMNLSFRYPITLNAAGVARPLGTISLLVAGIGAASDCRGALKWTEVR